MFQLDYAVNSVEKRKKIVEEIIARVGEENLRPNDLERLANYLVFSPDLKTKKEIVSQSRVNTIRKREVGLKNNNFDIIEADDKNKIAAPHITITKKDINTIEPLKQLYEAIVQTEKVYKKTKNKKLKKMLIEMRKDQYIIKSAYTKPIFFLQPLKSSTVFNYDEDTMYFTEEGNIKMISENRIDFTKSKHIAALLKFYSSLVQNSYFDLENDMRWILKDLDNLIEKTLSDKPMYHDIIIMKIDGKSNQDIKNFLIEKYNKNYTVEYISYLYKHRIPSMIAFQYKKDWVEWFYTYKVKGNWKKCSRCGEVKLAHKFFYSKNTSSKDGFYTICKECRRKKHN